MWDQSTDFVVLDTWYTFRHHACAGGLNFTRDAPSDSFGDLVRFLSADRVGNPAGFRFHHGLANLMGDLANTFFGHHATNLIRDLLHMRLADRATGPYGNFLDDLFRDHPANLVRNFCDHGFRNHPTDRDRTGLANDLRLVGGTGDLSLNNVRTPDPLTSVESGHLGHADLRTAIGADDHSRTARTRIINLFLCPLTTVLSFRPIGCDRSHDGVTTLLIDHFCLLSHDRLATFSFERFCDRTLNTATDFAC